MDTRLRARALQVPYGAVVNVKDGAAVKAGQIVANWDPHTHPIVSKLPAAARLHRLHRWHHGAGADRRPAGLESNVVTDLSAVARRLGICADRAPGRQEGRTRCPAPIFGAVLSAGRAIISLQDGAEVGVGDVVARIRRKLEDPRHTGGLRALPTCSRRASQRAGDPGRSVGHRQFRQGH
jgi:DNA-directed RNA polymerase subunit beta'